MSRVVNIERNLLGLEDVTFGTGTVTQTRSGQEIAITKINAQNLPFDEIRSLKQALEDEKARAFAVFGISDNGELVATYAEEGVFSINDDGEFIIEYKGQ